MSKVYNHNKDSVSPLMPKIGVLGLVPDYWGGAWQVRHQILVRLARFFHVVWFNRPFEWRDYWIPGKNGPNTKVPPNCGDMTIYDPGRWLPQIYRPTEVAKYLERKRLENAANILRAKGCEHILLYIWRPEFGSALDMVGHDLSFYHIDDEYTFSAEEQPISDMEHALIKRVDQVFIHSPALMAKKGHLNHNSLYVPNGVDYDAFSTPVPEPDDMKAIPRPRIGYMGMIKDKLDFRLILELARKHTDWSFVFVGPKSNVGSFAGTVSELESMSNVYFLGGKSVDRLPGYVQHFDVCSLSYVIDGYTRFIYPLKINEYLATGRPVVGVPIPSIELFRDVVKIAATVDEWSDAITSCLEDGDNTHEVVAVRQKVAAQNDWDRLASLIAREMCQRLGKKIENNNIFH